MNDATGHVVRSLLQFLAGGGITAVVSLLANGLSPAGAAVLLAFNTLAVTIAQNFLEQRGTIPALLKPPGAGPVLGEVVDATGKTVGGIVDTTLGTVEELAGTIVSDAGEIVGAVGPKEEKEPGE